MKNMKQSSKILLWLLFLVISCCTFPIYNFTKDFGKSIVTSNLILNVLCYYELGKYEKLMLKGWKIGKVLLVNMGVILLGMVMRFFLEMGKCQIPITSPVRISRSILPQHLSLVLLPT